MAAHTFFSYLLLSCGPPLAVGLPFFYHRSLLALTVITAMFIWLAIMIATSALFRGFVAFNGEIEYYVALVVVAVGIEEAARFAFWRYGLRPVESKVAQLAATGGASFSDLDKLALSYSIGWGHGFTHMLFQFLPFLPVTWEHGVVFTPRCNIDVFLMGALNQLGIFALLAGGQVVFTHHMRRREFTQACTVPVLHFVSALLTIVNFSVAGCNVSFPVIILAIGLAMGLRAAQVAWKVGLTPSAR